MTTDRVSTALFYNSALIGMQNAQSSINQTQAQISSGQRILHPSDDPVGITQTYRLDDEIARIGQYTKNIDSAQAGNQLEESTLTNVNDVLTWIRNVSIKANNPTLSATDRKSLTSEIQQRLGQLTDLLNTKDSAGSYIFAGFQGGNAPFVESDTNGFIYNGDEGQRFLQTSSTNQVAISDPGKSVFVNIPTTKNTVITKAGTSNAASTPPAQIFAGKVVDQAAFDAAFPEQYVVTFQPTANSHPPGAANFSVVNRSNGAPAIGTHPPGPLTNITYTSGQPVEFNGVQITVAGNPQPGDVFFVEPTNKLDILNTIQSIADNLTNLTNDANIMTSGQTIAAASTAATSAAVAGNGISTQTLTITKSAVPTTTQTVNVNAGDSAATIAAALDALTGVTAVANPTMATLDVSGSGGNAGDTMSFTLNGQAITAQIDAVPANTYANIQNAITTALGSSTFTSTNLANGQFTLQDTTGNNIALEDFRVINNAQLNINNLTNFDVGETINLDLAASNPSDNINVNYVVGTGSASELAAAIQASITSAGKGSSYKVTENAGTINVIYLGDTNGGSALTLNNFSDTLGFYATLNVTPATGSTQTVGDATLDSLNPADSATFLATDTTSTATLKGAIGNAVTLTEGTTDSSVVSSTVKVTMLSGYDVQSSVAGNDTVSGGLFNKAANTKATPYNLTLTESLANSIANIDNIQNNVLLTLSTVGSRLDSLDATRQFHANTTVDAQAELSKLRDLDYAAASTQLNLQLLTLQAAQASFAKINGLTLFDYIH